MISDEDEEEYNTRSSRSRRRVSFMSSTSSTSSSVTSYSATSRQLIDRLTDHLALYHAAASAEGRQRQIGGDRKVNGEEKVSKVLPQALVWFHSMKMEDKRKILTIADEIRVEQQPIVDRRKALFDHVQGLLTHMWSYSG